MRMFKGIVNGILMVTLIKPLVRVMVGRWRKRVQEAPATAIGLQVQELFEAALVEELSPNVAEPEIASDDLVELAESPEGRSALRLVLVAGVIVAAATATAYAVRELRRRRRAARTEERALAAVPIETGDDESIEDVALEALAGEA